MNAVWMWFWMSCKRYIKRRSFLAILLLLPVGTFVIRSGEQSTETRVPIAIYAMGGEEDGLEQQLIQSLLAHGQESGTGLFHFYQCQSEQQVKDDVASRRAESGYVIGEGLQKKLDQKEYKHSIQIYSAPSTVMASLSAEVVFASLMELYGKELLQNFVLKDAMFSLAWEDGAAGKEQLREKSGQIYEKCLNNGSTFSFEYRQLENGSEDYLIKEQPSVFPVRGLVSVFVFVTGLYLAAMNIVDEQNGVFLAISYRRRTPCQIVALAAPVCLAALSGLAALWSGSHWESARKEWTMMLVYVLAVSCFSWMVRMICRRVEVIGCLIPFFLAASLVFCPVFVDVSRYLPAIKYAEKLFLPWYYLHFFG